MGLNDYQKKLPDSTGTGNANNNFNRPPISTGKGDTSMDGWRGGANFGNVLNGTSGVEWNKQYTNWDINSGSSGTSKAEKIANAASIFGMVVGGATASLSIVTGIAGIVNSNKEAKAQKAQNGDVRSQADQSLSNAKSVSKSTDIGELSAASADLNDKIESLESRQQEIDIATAEKNVATIREQRSAYKQQDKKVKSLDENFADLVNKHADLSGKLKKMKPEDEGYQALKAQVDQAETAMQKAEKELKAEKNKLNEMPNPSEEELEKAKSDLKQQKSDKEKIPGQISKLKAEKEKIDTRIETLKKAEENPDEEKGATPVTTPVNNVAPNAFSGIRRPA